MLATLVLATIMGGPGLVLDVTEDLELAVGGDERVVSISVTRTCQPGQHILLPESATIQVLADGEGIEEEATTMGLPMQICSATPRMTFFTDVWMNASSWTEPGVFNATALMDGPFVASDAFNIIVRASDDAWRTGGGDIVVTPPADEAFTISEKARRMASALASIGFAIGLLRGPRLAGTWGRQPFRLAVVPAGR